MARGGGDGRGQRGSGGADRRHVWARGRVGTRGGRVQRHRAGSGAGSGSHVATAPVVRTDLTNTVQVSGALGFAGSYTVANQMPGTAYTALPPPGQVVRRGHRLYEVDGSPVILLYGRRPEWRDLFLGVTPGPDVSQLDANLIALGYATPAALTVSDTFTAATSFAVQRWQAALGLTVTGVVAGRAGRLRARPAAGGLAGGHAGRRGAARDGRAGRHVGAASGQRGAAGQPGVPGPPGRPGQCHAAGRHQNRARRHHRDLAGGQHGVGLAARGSPSPGPSAPGPSPDRRGRVRADQQSGDGSGDTVQRHRPARASPRRSRAGPGAGHGEHRQRPGHGVLAVPVSALVALAGGGYAVQVITGGAAAPGRGAHRAVQQQPGPGERARVAGRAEGRGARAMTGQRGTRQPGMGQPGMRLRGMCQPGTRQRGERLPGATSPSSNWPG